MNFKDSILLRVLALYLGVPLGFCLMLIVTFHLVARSRTAAGFEKPDDVKIAREELAQKFAGPRYFQVLHQTADMQSPYIPVKDAIRQTGGIAEARRLDPATAEKIGRLVEAFTEPAASRVVGEDRVNTLQLNLALDGLK